MRVSSFPRPVSSLFVFAILLLPCLLSSVAQEKPSPKPEPDVLVLSNGDTLHGKFVSETAGKVTFHCDPLGDVTLAWDKIKELHTSGKFAVLEKNVKARGKKGEGQIPVGPVDVENQNVTVHVESGAGQTATQAAPTPVKNAQFILDEASLNKEMSREPGFFSGWNGAATAGATIVAATQNQYTVSGSVRMTRQVPTVSWLDARNRTSAGFSGSFGKITQPGYVSGETTVPETMTKSAISHGDAERDQYFSPRFYVLAQLAYDHNYGQALNLQQIYGGGIGWSAVKNPKQELDLKGSIQYETQSFISGPINGAPGAASTPNTNLIGSTVSANYVLHLKHANYTQSVAFIPAFNEPRDYSANETNILAFPAYKNLSFSLGTTDSYLNNSPFSVPLTKPNSFQFTMGLTYAIKSKY